MNTKIKKKYSCARFPSFSCVSVFLLLFSTEPVFNKDQPLLTHINSTHAGLNLQGWTSGGCPITDLMLDFRPKGTWAWQSLKANSTTQLFLSELREATWYELKMKACNSAGCGNQSSQFATTDYDGSEYLPLFCPLCPLPVDPPCLTVPFRSAQVQSRLSSQRVGKATT